MADNLKLKNDEIPKRLASLIVTRSPSSLGEIPEENVTEQNVDDRKSGPARLEHGDTGEVYQQG